MMEKLVADLYSSENYTKIIFNLSTTKTLLNSVIIKNFFYYQGVTFPAMHSMWGVWAPPVERSRLVSLTYAGCHLGTVIAQPIAGLLCSSEILGGWPSVFYIFGKLYLMY